MQTASAIPTRRLTYVALASLVALMLVSLALVAAAPTGGAAHGLPPGAVLAFVKIGALAYLAGRVWHHRVYSLQWSSMFILLFVAEGTVRATSDPSPLAALGGVEAIFAMLYFVAVLAILRPLKKQARAVAPPP